MSRTEVERNWSDLFPAFRVVCVGLTIFAIVWLAYQLITLIVVLLCSVLFSYALRPAVATIRRHFTIRRSRPLPLWIAIALVYIGLAGGSVFLFLWLAPKVTAQATALMSQIPSDFATVQKSLGGISGRVVGVESSEIVEHAATAVSAEIDEMVRRLIASFVRAMEYLPSVGLVPILAFFFLNDASAIKKLALTLVPAGLWRVRAERWIGRADEVLAAYVRAQLAACLIVGVMVGAGLTVLGVPFPIVLGMAAGFGELVPLVGPLIVAVITVMVAALHHSILAVWALLYLGSVRVVEDYLIYPRLIGNSVRLHPLAVILAVLAGGELGGVVGVMFAVPVLAVIQSARTTRRG